jgi:hypothetical protein
LSPDKGYQEYEKMIPVMADAVYSNAADKSLQG